MGFLSIVGVNSYIYERIYFDMKIGKFFISQLEFLLLMFIGIGFFLIKGSDTKLVVGGIYLIYLGVLMYLGKSDC